MLPKRNRVDKKGVDLIFKKGRFITSTSFTFKFILTGNSFQPRISFITPKSISKLAVKRNFLRRKGYSVFKKHIKQFPFGIIGIFIFKKYQNNILTIENEIKSILNKIN